MRHFARYCLLLALVLGCSALALGQGFSVESKSPAPAGSETFTSMEGRFTISLPKQISGYSPKKVDTPVGPAQGHLFNWKVAYGQFIVGYIEGPGQLEKSQKTVFDNFRDNFVAMAREAQGKLLSETEMPLDGHPGREFKIEFPDSIALLRFYLINQRMYQVSVLILKTKREQEADAVKILASFKLLTEAEVEAESRKKMAEATPGALPQSPITKKLKSDAEDEGLKGRVKTILIETEDLSGTWVVQKRKPSSMNYYNEQGNLTKKESYDYRGNLSDITVYGYLDGERVSDSKHIEREYNPPPMMIAAPAGQPKPNYDPRYTYKFTYMYDEKGNLKEEFMRMNNGKLWLRYVYNLKGNQKETLVYDEAGSLNQKYVSMLDDKGNEIEKQYFDTKTGTVDEKYSYAYEFDSKGNWIKRTASKWVDVPGKSSFVPDSVTYRTITYY